MVWSVVTPNSVLDRGSGSTWIRFISAARIRIRVAKIEGNLHNNLPKLQESHLIKQ